MAKDETARFGARSPEDVYEMCKAHGIKMIDVRFVDLPGTWQHFSVPVGELEDSCFDEGIWNSGAAAPNLGYRPRYKEGYFPCPPTDKLQDLRSEIVLALEAAGIRVEVQHHEVGTAGQAEIDMRFDTLVSMADKLMKY